MDRKRILKAIVQPLESIISIVSVLLDCTAKEHWFDFLKKLFISEGELYHPKLNHVSKFKMIFQKFLNCRKYLVDVFQKFPFVLSGFKMKMAVINEKQHQICE